MTTKEMNRMFVECCYNGDWDAFYKAKKTDLPAVHLQFHTFVDALCKDREITEKQYMNAQLSNCVKSNS